MQATINFIEFFKTLLPGGRVSFPRREAVQSIIDQYSEGELDQLMKCAHLHVPYFKDPEVVEIAELLARGETNHRKVLQAQMYFPGLMDQVETYNSCTNHKLFDAAVRYLDAKTIPGYFNYKILTLEGVNLVDVLRALGGMVIGSKGMDRAPDYVRLALVDPNEFTDVMRIMVLAGRPAVECTYMGNIEHMGYLYHQGRYSPIGSACA